MALNSAENRGLFFVAVRGAHVSRLAIERKHILEGHDAKQVMNVGSADNRQRVKTRGTHAIERGVRRMIRMQVRKLARS